MRRLDDVPAVSVRDENDADAFEWACNRLRTASGSPLEPSTKIAHFRIVRERFLCTFRWVVVEPFLDPCIVPLDRLGDRCLHLGAIEELGAGLDLSACDTGLEFGKGRAS